ncbi:DNA methylase [Erysipelotrichaceae bacterium AF15-26LB]|nr:ImpB/MucB/SamB family protein [Erysipelotrichaceae bacterium 3_1_53]MCR0350683.1 DNA methylase [[Clostridium] innocuum]RJV82288.1 DNA methylase [Erysipelotrichaceae bacterium AF15-26LB]RJV82330.1 DNA methylase [Erysipelotrichaceae bacterium AF19-24AC]
MEQKRNIYMAIDLKSFYASVECISRKLDPLTTNLVVADVGKTQKTICLAVTPSLKKFGISGRARLFEVIQKVNEINRQRKRKAPGHIFTGESYDETELLQHPEYAMTYIAAPPRMAHYLEISTEIYNIYLKYISPKDIHVYSIDEVFLDVTGYLKAYQMSPRELAKRMILDILNTTGITATAGIGTNLYLCKVAMDIVAKRIRPDADGVRIAQLDEIRYRKLLWKHQPLTDFWRIGKGISKKLAQIGLYTMGDIAKCSLGKPEDIYNEDRLYQLFGINAQLLIDHAWGYEPCTMEDIKAYQPQHTSISTGQVLHCPYDYEKTRLVIKEMLDLLALALVDKQQVTDQIILSVGYDIENLDKQSYTGEVTTDRYGRKIPKHAHGTANLKRHTASCRLMSEAVMELFDRIVNPQLTVRRIHISANHILDEQQIPAMEMREQMDLFTDYEALTQQELQENKQLEKEKRLQQATLQIKKKYGKNAVLKGMNLEEGANTIQRNKTIGGHKA